MPQPPFDLYAFLGGQMFDKPAEDITREERQQAKKAFYVFAWNYHQNAEMKAAVHKAVAEYEENRTNPDAQ